MRTFTAAMLVFDIPIDWRMSIPELRARLQRKVRRALYCFHGKRVNLRNCEKIRRTLKRVLKPYFRAGVLDNFWYSRYNRGKWVRVGWGRHRDS